MKTKTSNFSKWIAAIFGALLSLSSAQAMAQDLILSPNFLERNVFANEIAVCSNIPSVNSKVIEAFFKLQFPGWPVPEIGLAQGTAASQLNSKVLLVALGEDLGPELSTCIESHDAVDSKIKEFVEREAEKFKSGLGALAELSQSMQFSSLTVLWGYQVSQSELVAFVFSSENEPYRSINIVTHIFGLDPSACRRMSACKNLFGENHAN